MATIKEVARRAGVSVGTVSNVMTGSVTVSSDLKHRVNAAVRELHYRPNHVARSLKTRQTKTIGMIISDITNPFYPQMVRGAEDAALQHHYMLVTFNTDDRVEREDQVLAELSSRKMDGLLLVIAQHRTDMRPLLALHHAGMPIVCLDRVNPGLPFDSVTVNNAKGSQDCVQHLIALGHRRIAAVTGNLSVGIGRERFRGYKTALREAGIELTDELVAVGEFRQSTAYDTTIRLLSLPPERRPTAIFSANSLMTLGVLRALEEKGVSCPQDIALATFDDLTLANAFRPHLTSVAQPTYEIGYRGAELLIERLRNEVVDETPRHVRMHTELRIRESTAAYPGERR
ncbi:MAG: LacI family DNA-binding transcriptional regulator [Bryobacteraceae bacterium]